MKRDSLPDLIVTYLIGTFPKTDYQTFGKQWIPGAKISDHTFVYKETSFIIDLNDRKDNLIWRVNSTTDMTSTEDQQTINAIIQAGFKKFAKSSSKKKK